MPTFKSVGEAATTLGVPIAWLKREAIEGRVPCLRAGRRFLFDLDLVRESLLEKATVNSQGVATDDH